MNEYCVHRTVLRVTNDEKVYFMIPFCRRDNRAQDSLWTKVITYNWRNQENLTVEKSFEQGLKGFQQMDYGRAF